VNRVTPTQRECLKMALHGTVFRTTRNYVGQTDHFAPTTIDSLVRRGLLREVVYKGMLPFYVITAQGRRKATP
jgi:hypothetical protein